MDCPDPLSTGERENVEFVIENTGPENVTLSSILPVDENNIMNASDSFLLTKNTGIFY
jgi:hypothetical protein